jgi:hypothetical protein
LPIEFHGFYSLRSRDASSRESVGLDIGHDDLLLLVDIGYIVLEILKIGLEFVVVVVYQRLRESTPGARFLEIGPQVIRREPLRPGRRDEVGDYSSSTHGGISFSFILRRAKVKRLMATLGKAEFVGFLGLEFCF